MKILIYALLCGPFALPALCDPTIAERTTIATEGAKLLIEKAEAKARALGRAVHIAVVDNGGNLCAEAIHDAARKQS